MDAKLLALVCLSSVLLLFGCINGGKSAASKSSLPSAPSGAANASPAGGSLGDKDISPQVTPDDASVLPDENLIPPDNLSAPSDGAAMSQGSAQSPHSNASSGADISQLTVSDSDIAIVEMNDSGIISDEDVVEPW